MLSRLKAGQRARWVWRRAAARYPWLAAMRRRLTAAVVSRARPAASSNLEEGGIEHRLDLLRRPQQEHLAGRDN